MKFANSIVQASLFKVSFTNIIMIYFFVISTLSTQILIRSQIDLGFHCIYLEITWKIHDILCHKRNGNPASVLTHFEIFITKTYMKVPGMWHKKPGKNLEFGTKNLEKTWNLVFRKKWELCLHTDTFRLLFSYMGCLPRHSETGSLSETSSKRYS